MTNNCIARLQVDTINLYRLVAKYPSTLLYPVLVLAAVLGVGIWGVTQVAHSDVESHKSRAGALATEIASSLGQQLTAASSPIPSLVALVHYNPNYSFLSDTFPSFVPDLAKTITGDALLSLQLAPFGVVRLVYPLKSNQAAVALDLFGSVTERDIAVKTVEDRQLTLAGPMAFRQGGYGVRVRMPIFVDGVGENATFGNPDKLNPYCGQACYDRNTSSKFWGFATALIDLHRLGVADKGSASGLGHQAASSSRLDDLASRGYSYLLSAPEAAPELRVITRTSRLPREPVEATIELLNNQWLLQLSPSSGSWRPSWYTPLMVVVVLLAVAVALMLFAALVSRRQHQILLEALLPREMIREMVGRDTVSMSPRIMQADTPADILLNMMGVLLEGGQPDMRDVLLIRTSVLRNLDIYQPLNLRSHIKGANLDDDVTRALMRQLGGTQEPELVYDDVSDDAAAQMRRAGVAASAACGADADAASCRPPTCNCDTLTGALALILTPHPAGWYDTGVEVNDAASDAALPTTVTECLLSSPLPSVAAVILGGGTIAAAPPPSSPTLLAPIGSRQMSMNILGGVGVGVGGVGVSMCHGASRELTFTGPANARNSASGVLSLPLSVQHHNKNALECLPSPRASTQSGVIPAATTGAIVAVDEALASGCSFDAAEPVPYGTANGGAHHHNSQHDYHHHSHHSSLHNHHHHNNANTGTNARHHLNAAGASPAACGDEAAAGVGGASGPFLPILPPLSSIALSPPAAAAASLHHQGSPRTGGGSSGSTILNPRSPLGGPRTKRRQIQSSGQLPYIDGSGQLCLSATFSGTLNVGQLPMAEDRASSRPGVGGVTSGVAVLQAVNARRMSSPPPPAVIEEVERLLAEADRWQFNTWKLREASGGFPLSSLGFFLMQRAGLIARFNINPVTLARLLRHIEAGYPDNPYHNATHAADVLQTLHVIIQGAQLHVHYLDHLGLLAAYFAAIIHDYGHPGVTNDFLIATNDPLAVRYNDRSPLENHHAAAAFSVLRRPELDFTVSLSAAERNTFRKLVIELVLATDMKQHFAVLSHFNTVHRLASFTQAVPGPSMAGAGESNTPLSHRSSHNLTLEVDNSAPSALAPEPKDDTERLLGLQVAIKAADLGHLGEELEVHQRWLAGLEEEFFRQGDRERELGLPISPLFDRAKQGVSKSQVGFYDFVALPLVHALSGAFPGTQPLMKCFLQNYNHWRAVDVQQPTQATSGTRAAGRTQQQHHQQQQQQQHQQQRQQQQQQQQQQQAAAEGPAPGSASAPSPFSRHQQEPSTPQQQPSPPPDRLRQHVASALRPGSLQTGANGSSVAALATLSVER